jgi:DNA-binding PadR family transcriptional regulator
MRRKPGALVPLEIAILEVARDLDRSGVGEFHGYQLAKHLAHVSDRRLLTAYGTLYRALGRLERMGLLRSRGEDPHVAARENRPVRRLYALTGEEVAAAHREPAARARGKRPGRRRVAPA